MLATVTVSNSLDVVNGDTSSIANLMASPGPDGISLREAVLAANTTAVADTVTFASSLAEQTIFLDGSELEITASLAITADAARHVTIDAQQLSRVLNFTAETGDLALAGVTLSNGKTTGDNQSSGGQISTDYSGGGVRFDSSGALMLTESSIIGNVTSGAYAQGGGIWTYSGSVTVVASTLSGNSTTGNSSRGGAIATTLGAVVLDNSNVSDNTTVGYRASGGGISTSFADVTLMASTLTGNATSGDKATGGGLQTIGGHVMLTDSGLSANSSSGTDADGGGIWTETGAVSLSGSTLSGNHTDGMDADGGGVFAGTGDVDLTNSTVSANHTTGTSASGGGVSASVGQVTLTTSTLSGNFTTGDGSTGGGIHAVTGHVRLNSSTLSENSTLGVDARGGGIYTQARIVRLTNSTVCGNSTSGVNADGGGIYIRDRTLPALLTARNTILAGNMVAGSNGPDLVADLTNSTLDVDHSLIGDTSDSGIDATTGIGNLLDQDPYLGPLADHGGPTQLHALLTVSPALDAGDPTAEAGMGNIPSFDQRGAPFGRVSNGRIDMGAFERPDGDFDDDGFWDLLDIDALIAEIATQSNAPSFDLDSDGHVDLADRDAWLAEAGALNLMSGNAYLLGDANLDGVVDGLDFIIWNANKFTSTGKWSQADWNADGVTGGLDFIIWNLNKFQSSDARPVFHQPPRAVAFTREIQLEPLTSVEPVLDAVRSACRECARLRAVNPTWSGINDVP